MRSLISLSRWLVALCATTTVLGAPDSAFAQLGVLNPNPTMPAERSLGNGAYGRAEGGMGIGRGPIPPGETREKNPAKEMLKSLEGTNYGRYRGRAVYSPDTAGAAGSLPSRSARPSTETARRPQSVAISPSGGRPENRWRYQLSQGRWWYQMDGGRWSYFDGERWVPYRGRQSRPAARRSRASGDRL